MAPKRRRATGSWTYKGDGMTWRPTTTMNAHDLSNDDDFVSHMLVEKLGTGDVPLLVHRMDPMRRLPKTSTEELLDIVRKVCFAC
jgi:histone-lysine N-methyltransferase SUV420H